MDLRPAAVTSVMMLSMATWPMAASGRDTDPRLHIAVPKADSDDARRPSGTPDRALSLLSQVDRGNLQAARTRLYEADTGPFDLTLIASRYKGGRNGPEEVAASSDRFTARMAGLDLGFEIGDGLRVKSELLVTHMRRHFVVVPNGFHPRSTGIGMIGVGIARDTGPQLMLDYVRVRPSGRRTSLERMTEVAGGAPLFGRGLQFALMNGPDDDQRGRVRWGVNFQMMRRPIDDQAPSFASATVADRRAELSLRWTF